MADLRVNFVFFGLQLLNLVMIVLGIFLYVIVVRLIIRAGNWLQWRLKYEEEILRKFDELIKLQQASQKDQG